MSNEIKGKVEFFNGDKKNAIREGVDDFGRQWRVITFSVYSKKNGGYLPFKSFDWKVIDALEHGGEYIITEFTPKVRINIDKYTGVKTKVIEFFALKVEPYTSNKNKRDIEAYKLLEDNKEQQTSTSVDSVFENQETKEEDDGFGSNEIDWDAEFN